jgi:prepilin signal peptidase PulO-like enzyme (type II secretory pathway)
LLLHSTYALALVLLLVIDAEQRRIPRSIVYPAAALSLAGSLLHPAPGFALRALLGGLAGFGILLLAYWGGQLFVRAATWLRRKPLREGEGVAPAAGLAFGDVRLGGLIGLMLGVPELFMALLAGIFLAGLAALLYLLVQFIRQRRYDSFAALPYGSFLAAGALGTLLWSPL